jgi:DNA-directed RNA polymerase subunit RPC12/RpoP
MTIKKELSQDVLHLDSKLNWIASHKPMEYDYMDNTERFFKEEAATNVEYCENELLTGNCPNCDWDFSYEYNYCPNCGQKILWNRITRDMVKDKIKEYYENYPKQSIKKEFEGVETPNEFLNTLKNIHKYGNAIDEATSKYIYDNTIDVYNYIVKYMAQYMTMEEVHEILLKKGIYITSSIGQLNLFVNYGLIGVMS